MHAILTPLISNPMSTLNSRPINEQNTLNHRPTLLLAGAGANGIAFKLAMYPIFFSHF
ncbi:hypothetical protein LguiA_024703 [Lonicera macranthoides]